MSLYIAVLNGAPIGHPIFEDNLKEAFPDIDPSAPDSGYEPFVRVWPMNIPEGNIYTHTTYEKVDGVWTDVYHSRPATAEELEQRRLQRIEADKFIWSRRPYAANFANWVYDETEHRFKPPVPRPEPDGKLYRWHGPTASWREAEPYPNDGKKYDFDFDNWINVEIV